MRARQFHSKKKSRWLRFFLILMCLFLAVLTALIVWQLETQNRPPRELAPYLERRAEGHNRLITETTKVIATMLQHGDRMQAVGFPLPELTLGAQKNPVDSSVSLPKRSVTVTSAEQLRVAMRDALPGDSIVIAPGRYQFSGASPAANKAGTAETPIIVRAEKLGAVKLDFILGEGFFVTAPYWRFENLEIHGACPQAEFCEHAFHVVGDARHFVARNNIIVDFNAHFKINGEKGRFPDDGQITHNTLTNTEARRTDHSVTPIDLVAASRWLIQKNIVTDFIKVGGDKISYGLFAKGGGQENKLLQNIVICEHRLRNYAGQRVGLSLGGGGTGAAYCRDQHCITEQDRSVLAANLVMSCADDGIYLNKAAASEVLHNTLIDTGGIEVRFPQSSANVWANLVDGKIRERDDGILRPAQNKETSMTRLYLGLHPVRNLFRAPQDFDFAWRSAPVFLSAELNTPKNVVIDLCAPTSLATKSSTEQKQTPTGAFADFAQCLSPSN